jgi:hypothetical protein
MSEHIAGAYDNPVPLLRDCHSDISTTGWLCKYLAFEVFLRWFPGLTSLLCIGPNHAFFKRIGVFSYDVHFISFCK